MEPVESPILPPPYPFFFFSCTVKLLHPEQPAQPPEQPAQDVCPFLAFLRRFQITYPQYPKTRINMIISAIFHFPFL